MSNDFDPDPTDSSDSNYRNPGINNEGFDPLRASDGFNKFVERYDLNEVLDKIEEQIRIRDERVKEMRESGRKFLRTPDEYWGGSGNDIAERELGNSHDSISQILEKCKGVDHIALAKSLVERGHELIVALHIEEFQEIDHVALADRLIEQYRDWVVADHLDGFKGVDHVALANMLLENGQFFIVAQNLEKFNGLDHVELANECVRSGIFGCSTLVENLDKFDGLDLAEVGNRLIEKGYVHLIANDFEKFPGVNTVNMVFALIGRMDFMRFDFINILRTLTPSQLEELERMDENRCRSLKSRSFELLLKKSRLDRERTTRERNHGMLLNLDALCRTQR